jgi:hypothetical protein
MSPWWHTLSHSTLMRVFADHVEEVIDGISYGRGFGRPDVRSPTTSLAPCESFTETRFRLRASTRWPSLFGQPKLQT